MKVDLAVLRRFVDLPESAREVRLLLDDVGVEVKRTEERDRGPLFTVELLANRGDHYAYAGIARELSGRLGHPVRLPDVEGLSVGPSPIPLVIEDPSGCLVYTATLLERPPGPMSSLANDALAILDAAGLHSVSAPVDATNLANIELGQPTHAFDADRISGGITVRRSRAGEAAWLLFTDGPKPIDEGTLVIADSEKILAIAGVIGCEDSKTTDQTTRLLLESATFDPVSVRKAARALGVHTDSSARFERGGDPTGPLVGAGRVVSLLEATGWARSGATGAVGDWTDPVRVLALDIAGAAAFLEYPLTDVEARVRLSRYGFEVSPTYPEWHGLPRLPEPASVADLSRDRLRTTLLVRVPPHRLWDVEYEADLYEELAKSIGYNESPQRLPTIDLGAVPSLGEANTARVSDLLVDAGFYEVITDGFYGRELTEKAGIGGDHALYAHVETLNSLDRGTSLLKNNAVVQAVDAVSTNLNMRHPDVRAFEWTRTFHPDPSADNGVCTERRLLWAIMNGHSDPSAWDGSGRALDAFSAKALVGAIARALRLDLAFAPMSDAHQPGSLLHPHRKLAITCGGEVVGALGEIHPAVLVGFKIKRARPVYLEISESALTGAPSPLRYAEPSAFHPIVRNLAFTLPHGVFAGQVATHMQRSGPTWLTHVRMTDEFVHEDAQSPSRHGAARTVTFELTYAMDAEQRTAEEVNSASEYLIKAVEQRFGERGVHLR